MEMKSNWRRTSSPQLTVTSPPPRPSIIALTYSVLWMRGNQYTEHRFAIMVQSIVGVDVELTGRNVLSRLLAWWKFCRLKGQTPLHGHRLRTRHTTPPTDTTNGRAHNNSTTNLPHRNAGAQHLDMSRCWDVANFWALVVNLLYNKL